MPHDDRRARQQAAAWQSRLAPDRELENLARMIVETSSREERHIRSLALELAFRCPRADLPTAFNAMLGNHARRAAGLEDGVPALGEKMRACRDWLVRSWISACGSDLRREGDDA